MNFEVDISMYKWPRLGRTKVLYSYMLGRTRKFSISYVPAWLPWLQPLNSTHYET